jgi:hypothetical protein
MPAHRTRLAALAAAVSGALLLLPAIGDAATTFGSRFLDEPNDPGCGMLGSCTLVSFIQPIDPNGDPYAGGAPSDGVITKFRIRAYSPAAPTQLTFRIADISRPDPNSSDTALATAAATGPTVTIPVDDDGADVPILDFPSRVTVKRGQHLAIDNTTVNAIHAANGDPFTYAYAPLLVEGQGARASNDVANELLVAASIEPDADKDGFGDETQDSCSTDATTQGACRDGTITGPKPPAIGSLRVSGGKISYALTAGATVELRLAKGAAGRKTGGKCVRPTRRNARKPRCTRFVPLGRAFSGGGNVGANTVALPKRNGKRLGAGSYRLTVTARGAAGKRVSATARFTIAPTRRHATR